MHPGSGSGSGSGILLFFHSKSFIKGELDHLLFQPRNFSTIIKKYIKQPY